MAGGRPARLRTGQTASGAEKRDKTHAGITMTATGCTSDFQRDTGSIGLRRKVFVFRIPFEVIFMTAVRYTNPRLVVAL